MDNQADLEDRMLDRGLNMAADFILAHPHLSPEVLANAVRMGCVIPPPMSERARLHTILRLWMKGAPVKKIAAEIGCSVGATESRIRRLRRKGYHELTLRTPRS